MAADIRQMSRASQHQQLSYGANSTYQPLLISQPYPSPLPPPPPPILQPTLLPVIPHIQLSQKAISLPIRKSSLLAEFDEEDVVMDTFFRWKIQRVKAEN